MAKVYDIKEEFTNDDLATAAEVLTSLAAWYRKHEPGSTSTIETLESATGCIPANLDDLVPDDPQAPV